MKRLTTVFRLIVMIVVAVIAVEGWQRYGPSAGQLKSLVTRALDVAQESLNASEQTVAPRSGLIENTLENAPALLTTPPPTATVAPTTAATTEFPAAPAIFAPVAQAEATGSTSTETPAATPRDTDRLPALMSRLEELGGIEPQLVPWGNGGKLYRFHCQAALGDTPNLKHHFESVAAEPLVAVEDVVAKVEAWRTAERDRSRLR